MFYKISLVLLIMIPVTMFQDSFWFNDNSHGDWEVSNALRAKSPYYSSWGTMAKKMAAYGPATHVGRINTGELRHPSRNTPRVRAHGKNSDFKPGDVQWNCQWTTATWADVNLGFAKCPGDRFCLPAGLEVLPDSSLVVETRNKFPCKPNPCRAYKITTCKPYESYKAQCVPKRGDWEMSLKWKDIDSYYDQYDYSNLNLEASVYLRSDPFDDYDEYGSDYYDNINYDNSPAYGVFPGDYSDMDDFYDWDDYYYFGEETMRFGTTPDGTNYTQYNYQILAAGAGTYWNYLDHSEAVLTVKYEGKVVRVIPIPQDVGLGDPDPDDNNIYIFGCFRNTPDGYYLDTSKSGFVSWSGNPAYYNWCNFDQCTT